MTSNGSLTLLPFDLIDKKKNTNTNNFKYCYLVIITTHTINYLIFTNLVNVGWTKIGCSLHLLFCFIMHSNTVLMNPPITMGPTCEGTSHPIVASSGHVPSRMADSTTVGIVSSCCFLSLFGRRGNLKKMISGVST